MIIVRIMGGPGNQFFQYAFAYKLAYKLKTELKFELWYDKTNPDSDLGVFFVLNKYNIAESYANVEEINSIKTIRKQLLVLSKMLKTKGLAGKIFRKISEIIPYYFYFYPSYIKDFGYYDIKQLNKIGDNVYLDGYWSCYEYFDDVIETIQNNLTVKKEFLTEKYYYYEDLIRSDPFSVAIHIKRGGYVSISWIRNYFGVTPLDYYYDAITHLEILIKNKPSIYVFTNDMDWVKENFKIDRAFTLVDCGPKSDFLELQLMSLCKNIVTSNSTFSWWGAYLNRNPGKIVITPKIWFANNNAQKKHQKGNFIPKAWIQM